LVRCCCCHCYTAWACGTRRPRVTSKETHIAPTTPVLVKHALLTASLQAQTAAQALLLLYWLQHMLPMHPAGWVLQAGEGCQTPFRQQLIAVLGRCSGCV
jgi:hypothetical protein